ncbi:hypothetical protein FQZ97_1130020 [compost metagenome]
MMKANAPTQSTFRINRAITSSPGPAAWLIAQNSPAKVMSMTTNVAVRNATSPCRRPKPESM